MSDDMGKHLGLLCVLDRCLPKIVEILAISFDWGNDSFYLKGLFSQMRFLMTDAKLALRVIEAICENECLTHFDTQNLEKHKNCFYCKVYRVAHSVNKGCRVNHPDWWEKTKKLYRQLSK